MRRGGLAVASRGGEQGGLPQVSRELIARAEDEGVDVIYVNYNYGGWNSSAEELA